MHVCGCYGRVFFHSRITCRHYYGTHFLNTINEHGLAPVIILVLNSGLFIDTSPDFTVTRVRSQGHVSVSLNVVTKDLWKQGYRNGASDSHASGPTVVRDLNSTQSRSFNLPNRTVV